MNFFRRTNRIENAVTTVFKRVLEEHANDTEKELSALSTIRALRSEKSKLEDEVAELQLQSRQEEREIEHKIGLAKIRQEAEACLASDKLDAREDELERVQKVAVSEARVAAKEEAMVKADELMGAQVERMERLVDVLVKALPTAELVVGAARGGDNGVG